MENFHDKIQEYLDGTLTAAETQAFGKALISDKNLADEVALYNDLIKCIYRATKHGSLAMHCELQWHGGICPICPSGMVAGFRALFAEMKSIRYRSSSN